MASHGLPFLLVFGTQITWPSRQYLKQLRAFLLLEPRLSPFVKAIRQLPTLWQKLVAYDPRLEKVPGRECLNALQQWVETGQDFPEAEEQPNVLNTPFTIIVHLIQYLHYLKSNDIGATHKTLLDSTHLAGIQGCCTGLLSAISTSCSEDEEEVVKHTITALNLAVCIGAFVDLDGVFATQPKDTTCFVVRWKLEAGKDVMMNVLEEYQEAYISVITDANTVTVTCAKSDAQSLMTELSTKGLIVKSISLKGRFHSAFLEVSAGCISKFCASNPELQFPHAEKLRVPLRSNSDAKVIHEGSLEDIALQSIMTQSADWHLTISSACYQSSSTEVTSPCVLSIGPVDSFPKSIALELRLTVVRTRNSNLISGEVEDSGTPDPLSSPLKIPNTVYPEHAVAVVGMGCRFPGADSVEDFWQILTSGTSMHQEVPAERFETANQRRSPGKSFYGNFIRDVDAFDHRFFMRSSREAASTDPQQRLLLQVAYEALESSGYFGGTSEMCEDIGCYVGVCASDYNDNVASHNPNAFSSLGTLRAFLTGKISHFFGWTGPSITYDTACSSSGVAIHAACKALQLGECSKAVAGGVSIFTSPYFYQNLAAASFLSPTGATKSFDAAADGYCRGEGVGLVVLKKLSDAVSDGDNVLGVISASAVNQCSNVVPITVPHSPSQIGLFRKILALADLEPTDVSFVEAHGTGTPVGDPLEFESIRSVFGGSHRLNPVHVGSVKANIGHTEGASGVAALIKTLLMMQHKTIPVQPNFKELNPKIPALEADKMVIPLATTKWDSNAFVACINNYGAAGSIAAMIVRQAPNVDSDTYTQQSALSRYPVYLSAKSRPSLAAYCVALRDRIAHLTPIPRNLLASISFNLAKKQNRSFPYLLTTTVKNMAELYEKLDHTAPSFGASLCDAARPKPVILAFGGQTSNCVGLNEEIYSASVLVRSHLDHCDMIVRALGYASIYPGIFSMKPQEDVVSLHAMQFALQYSCAMVWLDCGLKVDRIIGHSFGQLTALTVSGSLSLVDGLKLVCGRAVLMQRHWGPERGFMAALEADLDTILELMSSVAASGHDIEVACYNGPGSHVLVGAQSSIEAMEQTIAQSPSLRNDVKYKKLNVTHGFHSKYTEPILPGLQALVKGLTFHAPNIPIETCSEGQSWASPGPSLVAEHTRAPVYFGPAVERIAHLYGSCTWLEGGSNSSITNMIRRALSKEGLSQHTFHAANISGSGAVGSLADVTVDLWKHGHKIQFWPYHQSQRSDYRHIDLPPYQFEKSRHWLEWKDASQQISSAPATQVEEKREAVLLSLIKSPNHDHKVEFVIDPKSEQYRLFVQGHRVLANPLCPAPLYIELVAQAAMSAEPTLNAENSVPCVEKLEIKAPLGYSKDADIRLSLDKVEHQFSKWQFTLYSRTGNSTKEMTKATQQHATGTVMLWPKTDEDLRSNFDSFQRLIGQSRCEDLLADIQAEGMQGSLIYKVFSKVVHYSDYYKGVRSVSSKDREVAGRVVLPRHDLGALKLTICNPVAIDNFIQVAGLHVNSLNSCGENEVFVCTKVDRIQLSPKFVPATEGHSWSVFSNSSPRGDREITNDIFAFDSASQDLVFAALGARFTKVLISSLAKVLSRANSAQDQVQTTLVNDHTEFQGLQSLAVRQEVSSVKEDAVFEPIPHKLHFVNETSSREPNASWITSELRKLLSNITDVPLLAIRDDATMEDLGIDSLMVMEIVNEVRQVFGVDIPQTDLQKLNDFKSFHQYVRLKRNDTQNTDSGSSNDFDKETMSAHPATIDTEMSLDNVSSQKEDVSSRLAQLLALHLETSLSNITRTTNLADLGLDSLLCIELANDIKEIFGVTIDITKLTSDSTFGDLSDMLFEIFPSRSTSSSTPNGTDAATTSSTPMTTAFDSPAKPGTPKLASQEPASLVSAQKVFQQVRHDYDVFAKKTGFFDFWKRVYPSQARLVLAYVVEAFSGLGCSLASLKPGEPIPQIETLSKHSKLKAVMHEILRDGSLIHFTGLEFVRSEVDVDTTSSIELYQKLLGDHPKHASEHELLSITGSKLASLLTGAADPLQLLFGSKKNRDLLEEVYTNGPMYDAITRLLGTFLGGVLKSDNDGRTFHIMEIGGGTGSTTKHVIDVLVRSGISFSYTFTDISPQLVAAAKRKFAQYDFMDFMVLNIEKTPPRDLTKHFHIVLSTNCVHATRTIQTSMTNIHQLLRDDGFVSLVEFTRNIFWFDLVFGLLEGWWLYEDGRDHVLADAEFWQKSIRASGFKHVTMTDGPSLEARTLRIITGFIARPESSAYEISANASKPDMHMETLAYKSTENNVLCADLYYPRNHESSKSKRPVALMIHGGGHVMLSRKDVRPKQIQLLLDNGLLPVSIDYRLCPELNLLQGPMTDVCDALQWARDKLPTLKLKCLGVQVDGDRVVAVGWSSGGHLAMSLGWTAPLRNIRSPQAVLAFYCPLDYEDEFWKEPNFPNDSASISSGNPDLLEAVKEKPITGYNIAANKRPTGGWMQPDDPRSRIILHMNWKGQSLPVLCNGLPSRGSVSQTELVQYHCLEQPSREQIEAISPYAQIVRQNYKTPTYIIHGTRDDLIPWQQAQRVYDALKSRGIPAGLSILDDVEHLFDLYRNLDGEKLAAVEAGYEFLFAQIR